ncbi:MAG: alpha/beta fold hydrolase [Gemmatimonadaceae bacterium]
MRRRTTWLLSSSAALTLIAGFAHVAVDKETKTLDATARAQAPGTFVQLRDGITHYDLSGPDTARTVVLLSGATVPFYLWSPTRDALAANGFRVLRYDYYGRGFSDRPKLRYDLAAFERQLTELLDTLGIRGAIDVAGVSMGGAVAAHFADRHSERVRTLTLIDPGIGVFKATPFPISIRGLGEYLLTLAASEIAKGQLTDFLRPEDYPDWVERYEVQMQYKGFRRSFIATMRSDVMKRPAKSFSALAHSRIPILLLWGKVDRTVPFALSDTVRAAFPRAEFHAIDGAAHLPHIEQAALVDSLLLHFLRSH